MDYHLSDRVLRETIDYSYNTDIAGREDRKICATIRVMG